MVLCVSSAPFQFPSRFLCTLLCSLQVVSGELSDAVLDQLSVLSQGVFLPLISNNNLANGATPEVVVKSVAETMHKFVASGENRVTGLSGNT